MAMDDGAGQLVDAFGRSARDLRISVTDRCDLRCQYCMPEEGLDWLDPAEQLSFSEVERLARLFVGLGIRSIRLTGGEPLVRAHLVDLVAALSTLGLDDLSLTTNGTNLARQADRLAEAGLKRVNISLDTLVEHRFAEITRRDVLDRVLAGIGAALDAGLSPVKINCVVVAGTNDDEILDFVDFARSTGCQVRFIETMPIGADGRWSNESVVPAARILSVIGEVHDLVAAERGSAPAAPFVFADGAPGGVGVVGSVTEPFCSTCDRLRLTADGHLRTCLFAHEETDLRTPLRCGASDEELVGIIMAAVAAKGPGHAIGQQGFRQPVRVMSRIGG